RIFGLIITLAWEVRRLLERCAWTTQFMENPKLPILRNMTPMELSRREWLLISSAAAGSLMHPAIASMPKRDRIRLSLNENPFGPSPGATQAIKEHLDGLSRYTGNELTELTSTIAAGENVATEQ